MNLNLRLPFGLTVIVTCYSKTFRNVSYRSAALPSQTLIPSRQLLVDIQRELRDVRNELTEIKGILVTLLMNGTPHGDPYYRGQTIHFSVIPEEIVRRFLDALRHGAPETFQDGADLPLKEGFDAIVYHFTQVNAIGSGWPPSF